MKNSMILITLAALFTITASATEPTFPFVGSLELGTDFDTPTCAVSNALGSQPGETYFAESHEGKAIMKIDGKIVEFKQKSEMGLWNFMKQDEEVNAVYVSGDWTVEIKGRVSDACEANEECEYTDMTLDSLKLSQKGGVSLTFTKLSGGCGV